MPSEMEPEPERKSFRSTSQPKAPKHVMALPERLVELWLYLDTAQTSTANQQLKLEIEEIARYIDNPDWGYPYKDQVTRMIGPPSHCPACGR